MIHHSLKHGDHWAAGLTSYENGVLLQLQDRSGGQVRARLTSKEADQIAQELRSMAAKARKNPKSDHACRRKMLVKVYGEKTGSTLADVIKKDKPRGKAGTNPSHGK